MTEPDVSFREADIADAAPLSVLGQAAFLETYAETVDGGDIVAHCLTAHSAAAYATLLATPGVRAWIAEFVATGAPIGFVVLMPATLPFAARGDFEISRLYVLSRFHGRRLGRELLRRAADASLAAGAERLLLGVYSRNPRAIEFYERSGFVRLGTYRFEMRSRGYDDFVMALALRQRAQGAFPA